MTATTLDFRRTPPTGVSRHREPSARRRRRDAARPSRYLDAAFDDKDLPKASNRTQDQVPLQAAQAALQKEQARLFRVAARTAARFKGPQFLGMFDYWRREYALEGGAPMYTPGPFERCLGCFAK